MKDVMSYFKTHNGTPFQSPSTAEAPQRPLHIITNNGKDLIPDTDTPHKDESDFDHF